MKAKILNIEGKEKGNIDLPEIFGKKIRDDIIAKVIETKKTQHPYSPSPVAGKQYSAKGKIVHRRKVWRSGYGRGQSRVPRKIFSQRGSQFNWEAAEVPHSRGGMRTHPPKILHFLKRKRINKKELKKAFESAMSATANSKKIAEKYSSIEENELKNLPFIIESKIISLNTKQRKKALKEILGEKIYSKISLSKKVRAGKGKSRGRKYKANRGLLFVVGKEEKIKTKEFESVPLNELKIEDIAEGGAGRLTLYTEEAIKELKLKENKK